MPAPHAVSEWKYRWDIVMNDREFRKSHNATADYTCHSNRGFTNKISKNYKNGTIYIKAPKNNQGQNAPEGHFIAYKMYNNKIVLFDPAPPEGTYGAWANKNVVGFIAANTGLKVEIEPYHTQAHEEDSFCATWSLAWLDPTLRPFTTNVTNGNKGVTNIFQICRIIANEEDFPAHVKRVFNKYGMTDRMAINFLNRTREWLNAAFNKNNPFWKIFED